MKDKFVKFEYIGLDDSKPGEHHGVITTKLSQLTLLQKLDGDTPAYAAYIPFCESIIIIDMATYERLNSMLIVFDASSLA